MTEKTNGKPNGYSSIKVIVFGVDGDCKPHAAWFSKDQADTARLAAKQLRFNVIEVTNGTAADLVAKLPPSRIHANGPGVVPAIREDLYEKVVAALNARGEAGREPGEPTVADMPTSWDAIKPGHVVLAHDTLVDGWWAAVVVARTGDKLTLRWRDYPGWPKVNVRASAVALVNSAGS
ncbi:MAG: hypothetical protein WAK97_19810 [Pseudolabrys sp.]